VRWLHLAAVTPTTSLFFLKKVPKRKEWPKSGSERVTLVISVPGNKFRNPVPACVILRKNFRNHDSERSVTKILLHTAVHTSSLVDISLFRTKLYLIPDKMRGDVNKVA
jgi:hypothetical protein